jgi:hypothetical protein
VWRLEHGRAGGMVIRARARLRLRREAKHPPRQLTIAVSNRAQSFAVTV